ncbi:alkaline phosphatase family protein [Jiangella ureilytica]|uniref:Alkaline phosphatase family protein n=1 Tax=Jiangella ureilytica TaxID=2530374 RepID=A0A4R4RC22_9ACTN|nr:alkaline phosphatase family protein [Jiangella ureilytica]TDC46620.1 alkaline phosphatase family protein [Jiangella ureilytica]
MPLPRYGEGALSDLLPSVLAALGVNGEVDVLGLPPARRYCVLLVDALGWNLLRAHPAQAPFLASLAGRAITAGTPTTTATSLTSLGTGLPPGKHGIVGYTSRVPGGDGIFNALKWDPPLDPLTYQPYPSLFDRASRSGVETTVIGQSSFRDTGLTRAAMAGPFRAANSYGQRVAAAVERSSGPAPSLVYVYDGDLDYTGHQHGWRSAAWRYQLAMVDRFAEQLYDELPAGTVFVVTADHGMVDVEPDRRIDVDDVPALREGVALVAGEARFRHVYTASADGAGDVAAAWRSVLGDRAEVLTRAEAVAAGWFGAVESRVAERIGDVVASVHGDCAVERRSVFPVETRLRGLHGALSEDELMVPLLVGEA